MAQVLVVTPSFSIPGGVTEFNKMLLNYSCNSIKPFFLSGAGRKQNKIIKQLFFLFDLLRFTLIILFSSVKIVHLNPSLGNNAIKRDGLLCYIAKLFNIKVYIHWHGWNPDNEYLLEGVSLNFLKRTIFKADHIKFLSSTFAKLFIEKGFTNKTSIGNTFIDDALLDGFKTHSKRNKILNILFLSTISKNKGIYLAIEMFSELAKDNNITLTIAGNGPELENIRKIINPEIADKVTFTGHVTGNEKVHAYKNADIYLFPSQYEGMPTSVLEAMGFGLPIICSSVGALPDFFENGKMGFILNKDDKDGFRIAIESLIKNKQLRESIGTYNHTYATKHFLASITVNRIDEDYKSLIS